MTVRQLNPITDTRWHHFVERHPRATVFHTQGWLESLRRTYGYEPIALTTSAPGEALSNGLVFCRIKSWLTGARTVSLPFSDHCEPLVTTKEEFAYLFSAMKRDSDAHGAKYVELRPITLPVDTSLALGKAGSFCFHQLDLRPTLAEIFRRFHKDCTQRKIHRAEREALNYEEGRSEFLLSQFYGLLVLTRRRQQLPPQPITWFRNLIASMGDKLKIRLVSQNARPVASILTLRHKQTLVYKYGCSDKRIHNLGGMHLLYWKAIQDAKNEGLSQFDLGRSDWDNEGLINFKDRWGANRSVLAYWRYGAGSVRSSISGWQAPIAKYIFRHMPNGLLPLAGSLVYRHIH